MSRWAALAAVAAASVVLGGCGGGGGGGSVPAAPEIALGQRLFRETRFAQFFAANCGGNMNVNPAPVDPVLTVTVTTAGGNITGPVAGPSMSCSACHLHTETRGRTNISRGLRTFGDFAQRSPIPLRTDGLTTTTRNSPPLVGILGPATFLQGLHFDGEFMDGVKLSRGTLTGRNYGWLIGEQATARAHVARVIREDDGTGPLAAATGGLPYASLLRGDPGVPPAFLIPAAFRIDAATASDDAILDGVAMLIDAFMASLDFHADDAGDFDRSPYDLFLAQNGLPRRPAPGEPDVGYLRRLRSDLSSLSNPGFISTLPGSVDLAPQGLHFGQTELEGLEIFLAEPAASPPSPAEITSGGIGNCLVCHSGRRFSDFLPHNIGVSQDEYDVIHGTGAFLALSIPDLATRSANPDLYSPATAAHPLALGTFRSPPDLTHPGVTDLGVWNVFANPDFPAASQSALTAMLASVNGIPLANATPDVLLPLAIASFKTPSLRATGLSAPYFHTGQFNFLEEVTQHYMAVGARSRAGLVRNPDPELQNIALVPENIAPVVAFLRSLTEDFE